MMALTGRELRVTAATDATMDCTVTVQILQTLLMIAERA
jgi:hypothetical protein